jgi:hypothetical protein
MAKEYNESASNGDWITTGVKRSINIIGTEKEIIFKYENPKNTLFDMTDFPALPPSVEILELEELMFALLSKASD